MLVKCEFYQSFGDSLSFDNEADNNAPALKISWLFFYLQSDALESCYFPFHRWLANSFVHKVETSYTHYISS